MKRLIIITSIFLLMGCCYAGEYSTVNVNGVDFEIPSEYAGGDIKDNKYVYKDLRTFAILCVDDYLVNNFGGWASTCDYAQEITINGRPCTLLIMYNKYIDANVSYLYFPVKESVYCICFKSDNITPEISHIVETAPDYNMSSDTFYGLLDEAYAEYKESQYQDALDDDVYYDMSKLDANEDKDGGFIWWFIFIHNL